MVASTTAGAIAVYETVQMGDGQLACGFDSRLSRSLFPAEHVLNADIERPSQPKCQFQRRSVLAPLNGDDRLTRHADPLSQLLLGHFSVFKA